MKTMMRTIKVLAVAGMTMGLAQGAQADSSKVKIAQEVTLQPGWNAFSLNVSLEETPDAIFSNWPVSKVGRYNQEAFFEEGQTLETMSTEDAYVMWRRGESEQSPLKFISSGTYICFNTNAVGADAFTTTLYGRPSAPAIKWHVCSKSDATNLWNLVGFSVEEDKDTTLARYFDGFDGKIGWASLKVGGDDPAEISWEKLGFSTAFSNGMAVVMTSSKASTWSGAFGVTPSAGLDYIGTAATNLTISITNASLVTRTFKMTFGAGASQGSAPAPTLPTGLMLRDMSDSANVWVEFSPTAPFTKELNAGEKVDLEIAVDRTKLTGATGRYYAGVITVTDPENASSIKVSVPLEVSTLDPDYASDDGHDWMYNHAIEGKEYEGEAAETSVDLFYVYPTLTGGEIVIDGFRGIDDPTMRGDEVPSFVTAAGAFYGNARCFADMTHVYAPYYRQATLATAFDCATNGLGGVRSDANQRYLTALYEGPAYTDVTNALETYFMKWNKGRKFMLAGHSQGSAILRLVMEKYFMQDDMHKALLKNLVTSYQIGYGVSKAKMDNITAATGVTFATTSNDVGVVVSYNLFGPGATGNSVLLPDDPMAINPISWSRGTAPADKSLNLGAISQLTGEAIGAGLYGATVNADRGTVECAEFPASAYVGAEVFGEKSLHGQDYPAFWENLRENNYVRGGKSAGFCKLCTTNFPAHLCVSNAYYTTNAGTTKWVEPVDGTVWIPTNNLQKAMVYLVPEKGYRMFNGDFEMPCVTASLKNYLKDGEYLIPGDLLSMLNFKWIQRAPDYTDATGKDWLFHHDIPEKKYAGEPTDDPGVDLFYLYPTAVVETNDHAVDNICDIDDEFLRSDEGALFSWEMTGEVFGDYTCVYAPYYRQTPVDYEIWSSVYEEEGIPTACNRMAEYWYNRAPYTDVTNALTHYFTVINPDQGGGKRRPFIFAGHSHGSGMLRLVMERFFTNETQKAWLANMVACYAVGFGIGKDVEKTIKEKAGVPFATNATDTGVYIMWNTQGGSVTPGSPAALWPADPAASVNPLTWTREPDVYASSNLNLGAWTAANTGAIRPGLYDASNLVANGTIVCSSPDLSEHYMPEYWGFGENSLHRWDYKAYWDNIRANGLQRIQTWKDAHDVAKHSQIPLIGQPIDYTDAFNWVTNSITATGVTREVDALFFYPTMELEGDSTFMPVTDAHKATAYGWYTNNVTAFEGYANIIMPAYRQMNMAAVTAGQTLYPTGPEFLDFLRRTVSRTDLFAALDEYFTNINPGGKRPFFLAGHSQGSSQIKVLLQDYFTRDENKAKLNNLVAAYALGYSFDAKWIEDLGLDLNAAVGTNDTKVVVSWNTEGMNAVEHSFVVEDGAIAINPMNWTTNANVWSETTPDAMIQKRAGYADGTYVLVTTNSTEYMRPEFGMGERSLHGKDWSLWFDQIRVNGFTRFAAKQDLKKVETTAVPTVAGASWKVEVQGGVGEWNEAAKSPVDGCYYVSGFAAPEDVRLAYTLDDPSSGKRFANGETTTSFPMKYEGGIWSTTATEAEIAAGTQSSDTPKVLLGVVAQRYPWNGTLDVEYKTLYANATVTVTFYANGIELGTAKGTGGQSVTTSFDLNTAADGAFKDKALKNVKITATIEK